MFRKTHLFTPQVKKIMGRTVRVTKKHNEDVPAAEPAARCIVGERLQVQTYCLEQSTLLIEISQQIELRKIIQNLRNTSRPQNGTLYFLRMVARRCRPCCASWAARWSWRRPRPRRSARSSARAGKCPPPERAAKSPEFRWNF